MVRGTTRAPCRRAQRPSPFRKGIGRNTRQFVAQLASHVGYDIDYAKVDSVRWNRAARENFNGRLNPLKSLLSEMVRPEKAIAFAPGSPADAVKKYPDLCNADAGLDAAAWVARHKFGNAVDLQRVVCILKDTLTRYVEKNKLVPAVPTTHCEPVTGRDYPLGPAVER